MSVWTFTRQKLSLQARCFSSSSPARKLHPVHLSPEKMRALVAMYHQAETFVTRENLDTKINEAFTGQSHSFNLPDDPGISVRDLLSAHRARQDAPPVTEWNADALAFNARDPTDALPATAAWSSGKYTLRERKVMEALYGVERLEGGPALPGWDALNDHPELFAELDEKYEDSDF
ncbi:hypothetical protein R3P38DRAFT_2829978 [Favolaschia claudopus]|uniref:Uncharacterized protein n=1 Tax=Favolaschia claudopus TaxID=2862362 RepID=A0AAW0EB85_9AGAR